MSNKRHYLWAFVEKIAPLGISFVVSVIIARMVAPAAYGLIGMMAIFMALGQAFSELGFGAALVQQKEITADDETSVFVVNLVGGTVITAILCAASPLVAQFFDQQILVELLCVQSLTILIASTGLVQFALISRKMKFRLGAIIEVVATFMSGIVGISMAYAGYGVWSLVGLGVSRELVRAATAWIVGDWWPTGRFSVERVRAMWSYCSKLLYASLFHRVATNLHTVIIGKIFAPEALGLYARASGLQALPGGVVTGIVQRVAFPAFSRNQDNKVHLLYSLRKQVRVLVVLMSVSMALLGVLAAELVPWLFGPNWIGSVPLLQILCLGGAIAAVFPLHSQMTMALGESGIFFKVEMTKKLVIVIVLAVVYRFGIAGFAWGAVIISFADYCLSAFPSTRLLGYSWRMQIADLLPAFILNGAAAVVILEAPWDPSWPAVLTVATKATVFLMLVATFLYVFRSLYFADAWDIMHNLSAAASQRLRRS